MRSKKIALLVVVLPLIFSAVGLAQEKDKLRVSTLFIGSSQLPIWVGQDRGIRLIRHHLRLNDPEIAQAAYDDGATLTYPYFSEKQFQVALDLMSKSLEQTVDIPYKQVVDQSLLNEMGRGGTSSR